ncbi:MAG: response regulator [Sterolibacterium sp.]
MTIFVVDNDSAVRDSLTLLIEQEGLAVESFDDAQAFLAAWQPGRRGCAIIDLRMPGMDGLRLQAEMSRRSIPLPIIFLTGHGDIPTSVRAIKAGAFNFLTKSISGAELMTNVHSALAEDERRRRQAETNCTAASRLASLTKREREVMALAINGLHNKEIARRLGISHRTVEIHKAHIMHKTGAATLLDLSHMAEAGGFHA